MSYDFFSERCSESPRKDRKFGICDDKDNAPAYSDHALQDRWIATVENPEQRAVVFIAVDGCTVIRKPDSEDVESTCDGMLTWQDHLVVLELKDQKTGWREKAFSQLENTLALLAFHNEADLEKFRFKKAYACNKKHPRF